MAITIISMIKLKNATFLNNPSIDTTAIEYPRNNAPVSPIKILDGWKLKKRKPKELPGDYENIIKRWKRGEISAVSAIKKLNISKSTFYRLVR